MLGSEESIDAPKIPKNKATRPDNHLRGGFMATETPQQAVFANELHWVAEPNAHENEVAARNDAAHALSIVQQNYARIAQSISQMWGTEQFDGYIEKLLIDDRGSRQGFPPAVAEALLRLSRLHVERFGFGAVDDVWISIDWRDRHS